MVLVPARMASTRLPGKPLAEIAGLPMIVHVARRSAEADIGPVAVATDSREVAGAVADHGFAAVMTRADHPSGSDRIFEALATLDPDGEVEAVVNVQGDLPTIDPAAIRTALVPLGDREVDLATLATVIRDDSEKMNENVVKLIGSPVGDSGTGGRLRALYFTRAVAPWGEGPLHHHVGLYAWRRDSLARFVALPPSALERRERLEQLRALENGMRIDAMVVDTVPLGVDTPADLERAREILA